MIKRAIRQFWDILWSYKVKRLKLEGERSACRPDRDFNIIADFERREFTRRTNGADRSLRALWCRCAWGGSRSGDEGKSYAITDVSRANARSIIRWMIQLCREIHLRFAFSSICQWISVEEKFFSSRSRRNRISRFETEKKRSHGIQITYWSFLSLLRTQRVKQKLWRNKNTRSNFLWEREFKFYIKKTKLQWKNNRN